MGTIITIVTYLNAIFSALLVVYIFKSSQDDGSELIISAKPLSRKKVVFIKFLIFIIYSIFFSIISSLFSCFAFFSPNSNPISVLTIIYTLVISQSVCVLFFGSIAIIASLYLNKALIIMTNVFIIVASAIYSISIKAMQKETSSIISRRQQNAEFLVTNSNFVDKNGYGKNIEAITSIDPTQITTSLNIDYAKEQWQSVLDEAKNTNLELFFNLIYHQQMMHYLGNINEMNKIKNATSSLGQNPWYNYKIEDKLIPSVTRNIVNATDDDYSWTSLSNKNLPLFYIDTWSIPKSTLSSLIAYNTSSTKPTDQEILLIKKTINTLTTNQTIHYLTPAYYSDDYLFYDHDQSWNNAKGASTSFLYDGVPLSKNVIYYNEQNLKYSDFENDLFNYIIFKTLWDKTENNDFKNCFSLSSSNWSFNTNEFNFSALIYTTFKKYQNKLNINSDRDFGIEYLKLKNYIVYRLLGKYGYDNVTINDPENKENKIVIPYNDYFNFCFLTQYNSVNIRNIEDFNETSTIDIKPKEFFKDGFIALPYIGSETNDWIDLLFKKDPTSLEKVTKKISTNYDGTKTPTIDGYDDLYKQYDVLNYNNAAKTNTYGYFSEISLRTQALIRSYAAASTYPIIEKNGNLKRDDHYISSVTMSSSKLFTYFERLFFSYSAEQKISPYFILTSYFALSVLFMSYGYVKYIKYDFK